MATVTTPPPRAPVNNLANQLTAARFVLAIVLFGLIAVEWWGYCLAVFVVAAFTDWLDGYLARAYNLGSTLGRNLDPLVDKVLMCGAFISLLPLGDKQGWLFPWMVTIIVARELVITGLRSFIETTGANFGADWLGKFKMGLQCAALIAIFIAQGGEEWFKGWPLLPGALLWIRLGFVYATVVITLLSGLQYLWRAAMLFRIDTLT
jgi:CDP-diacylglycerol---glycerol-3-phosphate 3-phosphatidyltransferase